MANKNEMTVVNNKYRIKERDISDRIFHIAVLVLSILCFIVILYPLWFVVIASISNSDMVNRGEVVFWPKDIRFYGFQQIFQDARILTGYRNTLLYVVGGTLLNMIVTMPAAYALSRPDFKARNKVMLYFVFTMYFSGGLVPTYMQINNLGLINTPWILLVMVLINTYNLIIARTFIQSSIPYELYEACQVDGASHTRFFFQMVLPLSKAVLAVLALYYAVGHWNAYFNALLYLSDRSKYPLQLFLREILVSNTLSEATGVDPELLAAKQGMSDLLKYALIVVATVPILCAYPFVQKYFVKGVMIGSLKG